MSYEGLGFLAAERGQHREALEKLEEAIRRGSRSFLAHYTCARERFILSAPAPDSYSRLNDAEADKVQKGLETAIALMPDFGPAHHLLGFFLLVQEKNLASAEEHLKKAIQLEPESPAYLLTLAQVQVAQRQTLAARGTLELLCHPYVDEKLRTHAQEMLKVLGSASSEPAVRGKSREVVPGRKRFPRVTLQFDDRSKFLGPFTPLGLSLVPS